MLFWVLVPFAITAIYFARNRDWDDRFIANGSTQASNVSRTWFCFFQIVCELIVNARPIELTWEGQRPTPAVDYRVCPFILSTFAETMSAV